MDNPLISDGDFGVLGDLKLVDQNIYLRIYFIIYILVKINHYKTPILTKNFNK